MSKGVLQAIRQAGQQVWSFVSWFFQPEDLSQVFCKIEEGKKESLLRWVFEFESLSPPPKNRVAEKKRQGFIRWILSAEDLREVPGNGHTEIGKSRRFFSWFFSSEELPMVPCSEERISKSFIRWLLEGEELPDNLYWRNQPS